MTERKSAQARHAAGAEPRDVKQLRAAARRAHVWHSKCSVGGMLSSHLIAVLLAVSPVSADQQAQQQTVTAMSPSNALSSLVCASKPGERTQCAADTAGGVVLVRSTGYAPCLLGKTWGNDQKSVWVSDGCSAEFATTPAAQAPAAPSTVVQVDDRKPTERIETWGEFDPGSGFLVGRTEHGELSISAYGLFRYINQLPGEDTFRDHLGNERTVDGRQDFMPHRVIVWLKGWVGRPQIVYNVALWTVNTTNQVAIFANLGYQFSRKFSLYGGINGNPGTRSLQGSHPYWLGHDRVMADEFFRPYFGSGIWAQGELTPGLWYNVMTANSNSALDIKATQLDRSLTVSGSMWWMPTTGEFGPKGGWGDWEQHEELATRFGFSSSYSPEQRYSAADGSSGNSTLRLADSVNVFDTGALAPGTTVNGVDFTILSIDAGMKYKGFFLGKYKLLRHIGRGSTGRHLTRLRHAVLRHSA